MDVLDRDKIESRAFAGVGLSIAITFAAAQMFLPGGYPDLDLLSGFMNGIAVAVYGPLLRAAGPARGRMWSSIAIGLLGITHSMWLLAVIAWMTYVPAGAADIAMYAATGVVFAMLLVADLRTWRAIAIMSLATSASTAAAWIVAGWGPGTGWRPHHIGFPAMFLHLGIALTLFDAARRSWPRPVGVCPSCGYSLAGLIAERCPECGEMAPGSAARPASERRAT